MDNKQATGGEGSRTISLFTCRHSVNATGVSSPATSSRVPAAMWSGMSLCRTAWQSWLVFVKFLAPSLASLFDSDSLAVVGIHVFSREVSLLSAAPAAEMCWPRVSAAELKFNRSAAKCATGPDSCQTFPSASFVAHPFDPATGHQCGRPSGVRQRDRRAEAVRRTRPALSLLNIALLE